MKSLSSEGTEDLKKHIVVSETGDECLCDGPSCLHAHFLESLN